MIAEISRAIFSQVGRWLTAGVVATIVLALFMEGLARVVLGGPMKPALLICQVFGWDLSMLWVAEILHYALGLIFFPIGFVVLHVLLPRFPFGVLGAVWGIILWLAAGLVMAPAAGVPLMFGGGRMMAASLVAHLAYGVVMDIVYHKNGVSDEQRA